MEEQKYLFEILKSRIPNQLRLVDVVEESLGISADAAYKRIRGQKELSFSELSALSKKFSLPLEEIFNYKSEQTAMFHYAPVCFSNFDGYISYMEQMAAGLKALKSAPEKEICFAAQDIPLFYFLKHTELALFKLYAWNDAATRERLSYRDFCNNFDMDKITPIFEQIHSSYMAIPSKEIWTRQTVDTILRLLEYYCELEVFDSKKTVLLILNQLNDLVDTVEKYAEVGYKATKLAPYSLYVCSVDLENNFMLSRIGNEQSCRIKLYTINSMTTFNKGFCNETAKWINDLISKSILISGVSTRERYLFFQSSKNKIDALINRIEAS